MMKHLLWLLLFAFAADAQVTPGIPSGTILGNSSGSTAAPSANAPLSLEQNAFASASILRARDYGILPTNTAAQNDTAFATLKTKLQSSTSTTWRVIFEPSSSSATMANVAITGTSGQFSCTCTNLTVGQYLNISGTYGGTGSITGYANPTIYYVSATNGTSTFTLQTPLQGAIVTTAGTPTGLTYAPYSAYTYTNNRWLFGARNVILEAYGATFSNVTTDPNYGNQIPININDPFDDSGDTPWPHVTYANGDLINTATAGANTVTTTVAGNAAHYAPGNEVLIYGYDQQQSGYPPDMRYFEFATVVSANSGTGVVTLNLPIKNVYDSRWWDTANYGGTGQAYGAPRILNLNRTNYNQAHLLWIRGATFLYNIAGGITSSDLAGPADTFITEDVNGYAFNIVGSERVLILRSFFLGYVSTCDKIVNFMTIEDTTIQPQPGNAVALSDCVGTNTLYLNRDKFYGSIGIIAPRNLIVNDVDVEPTTSGNQGISTSSLYPVWSLSVANSRIFNTGGMTYGVTNAGTPNSFTLTGVSGTTMQMTWNAAAMTAADEIDYGMTLTDVTAGCNALVTGIYLTGGNLLNITQTGCAAPGATDVINAYDVINKSDGGGNVIVGTQVPFWRPPPAVSLTPGLTIPGGPTIVGNLNFGAPTAAGTYIQPVSYGLQFVVGATNSFYVENNGIYMNAGAAITTNGLSATGAVSLNASSNNTTNIGTGTTTSPVTIGGGSDAVTVNATTLTLGGSTLVTSSSPVTLSNAAIRLTGLASNSAATTGTVCWTTGAVNLTVDTTLACLSSTQRVKQNIQPLDAGLNEVMKLRPVSYDMRPEFNPKGLGPMVGLVAEETQEVDPRLVGLDTDGNPLGVRYMQLTAVLVKAIQDQQHEIDELKHQLRRRH